MVSRTTVNRPPIYKQGAKFVFPLVVCFRIINALCVKTFFQPDEYFQSLEPAWRIAFGGQSGAWITWEWQYQLRSSLHPAIFAALYWFSEKIMESLAILPQSRATILIVIPKILQGIFAAVGDYFTWKLAERIYGPDRYFAWTALFLTLLSPWQWFCSTRTLSNSLEVVLTTVALYLWPWGLSGSLMFDITKSNTNQDIRVSASPVFRSHFDIQRIRLCLVLAGFACILRPTNLLIWASLVAMIVIRVVQRVFVNGIHSVDFSDMLLLSREVVYCGVTVLGASAISDRLYFGIWTFPPYQWLNFNITQSLAVFYGTNNWHYYLSQGLPLLLTTYLPFAAQALLSLTSGHHGPVELSGFSPDPAIFYRTAGADLIFVVLTTITTLSLISHKEVRFIYPLLPCLHVLAAPYVLSFFAVHSRQSHEQFDVSRVRIIPERVSIKRGRLLLFILLVIANIAIGLYTTQVHQRGVIDVLTFVRHEYEELNVPKRGVVQEKELSAHAFNLDHEANGSSEVFAAFLMPCHSTPWRSHLIHPKLQAWALTCEPPLHIPANSPERASYRDEADRFYDDPGLFLRTEINTTERQWPRYLIGFEGIESILADYCGAEMRGRRLRERWRGFNSHWHDDSRRKGTVVVWDFIDS